MWRWQQQQRQQSLEEQLERPRPLLSVNYSNVFRPAANPLTRHYFSSSLYLSLSLSLSLLCVCLSLSLFATHLEPCSTSISPLQRQSLNPVHLFLFDFFTFFFVFLFLSSVFSPCVSETLTKFSSWWSSLFPVCFFCGWIGWMDWINDRLLAK